jgi:uncharacterized membrane protein YbhN (UPF0104 family)
MSSNTPSVPLSPDTVQANPKKPYKAIASGLGTAILTALTSYFTAGNDIDANGFLAAVLNGAIIFVLTFVVKNPKVVVSADRR